MVVSAHPQASRIGAEVLSRGGNAIDAMVATHAALAVAYPIAGNLGGGGFMIHRREDGMLFSLDFREKAPMAAHKDMYLNAEGRVIPGASTVGHRSVGVPGSVMGLWEAHRRFGFLEWSVCWEGAVALAREGFPITEQQAFELNRQQAVFDSLNPGNRYLRADHAVNGLWRAGDTLQQADLARTLSLIKDEGPSGFYAGPTADALLAEMQRGGGLITKADLEAYQAVWRKPIVIPYDSFTLASMGPPSSGGVALGQLLRLSEPWPLHTWGHNSSRTVHHLAEAERRVYADRARYLGDPDYVDVPVEELMDPAYADFRRKDIAYGQAMPFDRVSAGLEAFRKADAARSNTSGNTGTERPVQNAVPTESEETTHYSIVDAYGNAVSVTTTLNGRYGSKVFVSGAGFALNNEMDDFVAKPGVPNQFGLLGDTANAIEPGKRMLSSMTPTIVEKNGQLYAVIGSPGGSKIITAVFQTFLNLTEYGMTMQEAVSAPRFHHQHVPDSIRIEEGALADSTMDALRAKGHHLYTSSTMGRVDAILVLPDGRLEGGADPRGDDQAVGVYRNAGQAQP